jgi:hypothetical protein
MKLSNPYRYTVAVEEDGGYSVVNSERGATFLAPVTQRGPKIYVFSINNRLVYVGQTVQGMSARLRLGFQSDGTSGYYGYRWRRNHMNAELFVWCLEDVKEEDEPLALECIESEVVFEYRKHFNQWPKYQTEIHFYESTPEHRTLAASVFDLFSHAGF